MDFCRLYGFAHCWIFNFLGIFLSTITRSTFIYAFVPSSRVSHLPHPFYVKHMNYKAYSTDISQIRYLFNRFSFQLGVQFLILLSHHLSLLFLEGNNSFDSSSFPPNSPYGVRLSQTRLNTLIMQIRQ